MGQRTHGAQRGWVSGLVRLAIERGFPMLVSILALAAAGCSAAPEGAADSDDDVARQRAALADAILTVDGWMSVEDDYVPRVCTAENGNAGYEALKAQAIAARTYLYRAMRDDPSLGTSAEPVGNSTSFQAYAKTANDGCRAAAAETRGVVGRYLGQIVIANYVAGALVKADGTKGSDPTGTEHWVTYNEGLTGDSVAPTALSYTARSDNRGCMSQNRAAWLSDQGYDAAAILRYFYGADLELEGAPPPPSADACDVGYEGKCDGDVLVWCEGGAQKSFNCADKALACGWQDDAVGNNCVSRPAAGCGDVTYAGTCDGATLVWCEAGALEAYDCASVGMSCGWQDDAVGNNCL